MDTGYATSACLLELDDHRLWAVIADGFQQAGATAGVPPPNTGYPANVCLTELDDRTLRVITAYYAQALVA